MTNDREDAWNAFMNTRWDAGGCMSCDPDRDRGLSFCSACGSSIEQGKRSFWERVTA